jgi:hypothetical protein
VFAGVDVDAAARAWIDAWSRSWRELDAELLEPIYAPDAVFRSHPFRDPQRPLDYARWAISEEEGEPEWWAAVIENGKPITLAGTSIIRFGDDGRIVEQHDYWGQADGRVPPWEGWGL